MEKQSQSCNGAGLRGREKDGRGRAVMLESRAVVCNRNRVQQPVLLHLEVVRAPAYLKQKQDKRVGGHAGNLQESFSRGSD